MGSLRLQSLIVKRDVTSTYANYATYNNRKISDYDLVIIRLYDNGNLNSTCRASMVVAANEFVNGRAFFLVGIHGNVTAQASDYLVCQLHVWPQSDTVIGIDVNNGSGQLTGVSIDGVVTHA